jgi:HK97 family phage portal protein
MAFDIQRALASSGKALPAHPAFMGKLPVSTYSPGTPRTDAVISQRESALHSEVFGGSQAIDHVHDSIGLYADACSSAPYRLQKKDGTPVVRVKSKGTPPDHEVGPADLYRLLDDPNPFMRYDELISLLVIDLMLVGNAYWFKWQTNSEGRPLALYRLAPSHVKVVPGPFGPKKYRYQPPGVREPLDIELENMVHFKRPNPHSAYYGLGVIQGSGRSMDMELAITDTIASYYENKADPSLIVQSERRVPRDVFNKLRAQLRSRSSGSKNAGELMVLEAGLKASTLSVSARDALFADLAKMSRDRIFQKFRCSPMLFGILDESSGSNKVSDVRREFDNYTLRPFMERLGRQISYAVTGAWDLDFVIEHRVVLPADEAIKVAESVRSAPGIKIREVRKQYEQFGIEESTGDPEIDEEILNLPGEPLGPDGQPLDPSKGGFASPSSGSEPGRPPKVSNTVAIKGKTGSSSIPKGGKARKASGKALLDEIDAEIDRVLEGKALVNRDTLPERSSKLPNEQRPADVFAQARKVDIDASKHYIQAELRKAAQELEFSLMEHVEGKALKSSDLVGRVRKSDAWATFRKRVEEILAEGARRAASSGVMHSGLTPEEEVDYDEIASAVINRPAGVRGIVNTLKARAVARIKDARDSNAERDEYQAAVRAIIAEWSDGQVSTIADSEATHAYNEGVLTAAELSGVSQVYVTDGDDHDEPCENANGSVWDVAYARENRIEHPNCRRAFLPLGAVA